MMKQNEKWQKDQNAFVVSPFRALLWQIPVDASFPFLRQTFEGFT
jgi:hypothetical protein